MSLLRASCASLRTRAGLRPLAGMNDLGPRFTERVATNWNQTRRFPNTAVAGHSTACRLCESRRQFVLCVWVSLLAGYNAASRNNSLKNHSVKTIPMFAVASRLRLTPAFRVCFFTIVSPTTVRCAGKVWKLRWTGSCLSRVKFVLRGSGFALRVCTNVADTVPTSCRWLAPSQPSSQVLEQALVYLCLKRSGDCRPALKIYRSFTWWILRLVHLVNAPGTAASSAVPCTPSLTWVVFEVRNQSIAVSC